MKQYRPNVCGVITNEDRTKVLVFRRADQVLGDDRWQFPQGGLDDGETAEQALLRELQEEIGTNEVTILHKAPEPIRYDFPPEVLAELVQRSPDKSGFHGQEQHWFLVRLATGTNAIHFEHHPPEFDAFRWVTAMEALQLTVSFKHEAYRKGLTALGLL